MIIFSQQASLPSTVCSVRFTKALLRPIDRTVANYCFLTLFIFQFFYMKLHFSFTCWFVSNWKKKCYRPWQMKNSAKVRQIYHNLVCSGSDGSGSVTAIDHPPAPTTPTATANRHCFWYRNEAQENGFPEGKYSPHRKSSTENCGTKRNSQHPLFRTGRA